MQQFTCHKVVEAAKILTVMANPSGIGMILLLSGEETSVAVTPEWYAKHEPEAGGYYVRYADGYASYSPAKAFEEGYTAVVPVPSLDSTLQLAAANGSEFILQFFAFTHLPGHLQVVSRPYAERAVALMALPRNPERTVALRKLLESKDAAVRALLAGAAGPFQYVPSVGRTSSRESNLSNEPKEQP